MGFCLGAAGLVSPAPAATVTGNLRDIKGNPVAVKPLFVPQSTPMASNAWTVLDVPREATTSNGVFSMSLVGGFYKVQFGPFSKSFQIFVPLDTNTYQLNYCASLVPSNTVFFTWDTLTNYAGGGLLNQTQYVTFLSYVTNVSTLQVTNTFELAGTNAHVSGSLTVDSGSGSNAIQVLANTNVSFRVGTNGTVTAAKFVGDGSGLTGLPTGAKPQVMDGYHLSVMPVPPMGVVTWYLFSTTATQAKMKGVIDQIKTNHYDAYGMDWVFMDDAWTTNRLPNGNLQAIPSRFPDGIEWLSRYAASNNINLGGYTELGVNTDAGAPYIGSAGHIVQDAAYLSTIFKFIKFHGNWWEDAPTAYNEMQEFASTVMASGYPVALYNINPSPYWTNNWHVDIPTYFTIWYPATGKGITDANDNWTTICQHFDAAAEYRGIVHPGSYVSCESIVPLASLIRQEMSMFGTLSAPLFFSSVNLGSQYFTNTDVLAVCRDPAVIAGWCVRSNANAGEVWVKPLGSLQGDQKAVLLLNRTASPQTIGFSLQDLQLPPEPVTLYDLWARTMVGYWTNGTYSVTVPAQDVVWLKVSKGKTSLYPPGDLWLSDYNWTTATTNGPLAGCDPPGSKDPVYKDVSSCTGNPIVLDGVTYPKGLSGTCDAYVEYLVGGSTSFHTFIGVDDAIKIYVPAANPQFNCFVYLDGNLATNRLCITNDTPAWELTLNTTGAEKMGIYFAVTNHVGDQYDRWDMGAASLCFPNPSVNALKTNPVFTTSIGLKKTDGTGTLNFKVASSVTGSQDIIFPDALNNTNAAALPTPLFLTNTAKANETGTVGLALSLTNSAAGSRVAFGNVYDGRWNGMSFISKSTFDYQDCAIFGDTDSTRLNVPSSTGNIYFQSFGVTKATMDKDGNFSATKFTGDGSGLSNIPFSGLPSPFGSTNTSTGTVYAFLTNSAAGSSIRLGNLYEGRWNGIGFGSGTSFDYQQCAVYGDNTSTRINVPSSTGTIYFAFLGGLKGNLDKDGNLSVDGAVKAGTSFKVGTATGMTTNINVLVAGGTTNQLQFTGGILTGVVPQ